MKFIVTLVTLCLAVQMAYSQTQRTCKQTNECEKKECCLIFNPFIMSKRQIQSISLVDLITAPTEGVCTPHFLEGESCTFGFNQCGCEPGTSCKKVGDLDLNLESKMMIFVQPGIYRCVRNDEAN